MDEGTAARDGILTECANVPKLRVQRMPGMRGELPRLLPTASNTANGAGPWALWLGPSDWLIYSLDGTASDLLQLVGDGVRTGTIVVTEISDSFTVFELAGPLAVELLESGCGLDLTGHAVPSGACAQSHFQEVPILLHRPAPGDAWRVFVDRSLSHHLSDSLCSRHEIRHLRSR